MKNKINKIVLSVLTVFSVAVIGCTSSTTSPEPTLSAGELEILKSAKSLPSNQ